MISTEAGLKIFADDSYPEEMRLTLGYKNVMNHQNPIKVAEIGLTFII